MYQKDTSDYMMITELFIPFDNNTQRDLWENKGRFGTCGPTSIACVVHRPVEVIINEWDKFYQIHPYKGNANVSDIVKILQKEGYSVKRKRGNKSKHFPVPDTDMAIVRIQWLKDDSSEYYWKQAPIYTHYVMMQKTDEGWCVFCNSEGWFKPTPENEQIYLKLGYVSSYLEIKKSAVTLDS